MECTAVRRSASSLRRLGANQGSEVGASGIVDTAMAVDWRSLLALAGAPAEQTMSKGFLSVLLVAALCTVKAISQEIVIEPTNGRAPSTNRVSRPAAERSAPAESKKPATRSASDSTDQQRTKAMAKKARAEQIAAKRTATPAASPDAPTSEAAEAIPAPKKIPEGQPAWAMADTRDAGSLQSEIASALAHDPKLAGLAIQVSVNDDLVVLEGRVADKLEHLQAQRLARSYAWNRKLVDHLEVAPKMSAQK